MDLIVPLSSFSHEGHDQELRFMLRSVLANFSELGKIYLVGHCPLWIRVGGRIVHVPAHDFDPRNKDVNIIKKILTVVRSRNGEFLINSDDQIFCRPVQSQDLRKAWLANSSVERDARILGTKSVWHLRLLATLAVCRLQGWPELVFEVHLPYIIDALPYAHIMDALEGDYPDGLLTHIYFNSYLTRADCPLPEPALCPVFWFQRFKNQRVSLEVAREALRSKTFLNFDDVAYSAPLQQALLEKFPEPAPWESR